MTSTFNDLYTHELQALASAESQMVALLPQLAKETDNAELKAAFLLQADGSKHQLLMLRQLLKEMGKRPASLACLGMQTLLKECSDLREGFPAGNLRDTVMIAHMQRAEHYKMASYSSVHDYAKLLGDKDAAEALDHAFKAVSAATKALGQIAIQVNAEAYVDTRISGT